MLTIGDFSKLSRVPISALRYYNDVGLLKPVAVDPETRYRYYSVEQLPRLNRLLALREMGFSLEQIAQVLDEGLSREELRGMFRLKRAEIQQRVEQEQERLLRIEARIVQIEMEEIMQEYDVRVKQLEPQLVAGVRDTIASYQHVGMLLNEVYSHLQQYGEGGMAAAIWHDQGYKASDVDSEGIVFLERRVPESERVKVYELPSVTVASVVHHGAYNTFNQAYDGVIRWIEANGYRIAGPNREVYLYCTQPVRQDDESYVTEIQFPIEKKN